jgi:hypothetical protein
MRLNLFPKELISYEKMESDEETLATRITVDENSPIYCSLDGVLFDKAMTTLMWFPAGKKGSYSIPDDIIYVSCAAFFGCKHLVNIALPESLVLISDYAFARCEGLKTITLPMDLRYIGKGAFENCKNLGSIEISRKTRTNHKAFEGFLGYLIYQD